MSIFYCILKYIKDLGYDSISDKDRIIKPKNKINEALVSFFYCLRTNQKDKMKLDKNL